MSHHGGQYPDYIFPMYNIRFIALNDGIDTLNSDSADMGMMPIRNVVSALYGQNPKVTYLPIKIDLRKISPAEVSDLSLIIMNKPNIFSLIVQIER